MKKFFFVFFSILIIWFCYASYKYITRFGSVSGQVITVKNEAVSIYRDQPVFLIRGKVEKKLKFLDKEYELTGKPLEPDIARKKANLDKLKSSYDTHQMTVSAMEFSGKFKGKTFNKLKTDLAIEEAHLDSVQRSYYKLRETLDTYQSKYNERLGTYMSDFILYKTQTDEQGLYRFRKVPKGEYYIYTRVDSVLNAPIWQFKIEVYDNIQLILNQDNIQSFYK